MWRNNNERRLLCSLIAATACCGQTTADDLLKRALYLGDRYNWAEAGPLFEEAEPLFTATGDQRNALHARLGRVRANVEKGGQSFPAVSAEIGDELASNPLLQADKALRMFALIVKGDIDMETNTVAMRGDWEQVAALAGELGDAKWQYRALAPLGVAAFYDGDLETARTNVGMALAAATKAGDIGTQIRCLTMLATGLVESRMFEQGLPYTERALALAGSAPDLAYEFAARHIQLQALIGLGRLDAAMALAEQILNKARESSRHAHEATALVFIASIHRLRGEGSKAASFAEMAVNIAQAKGLPRILARAHALLTELYRAGGSLDKAEDHAQLAATATQESGDFWAVPRRLQALAELHVARARFAEADRDYDRAEAFIDASIGSMTTAFEKAAVIRASSEIYTKHFALLADHLNNSAKAYSMIEQVRGRVAADLLSAGSRTSSAAREVERSISRLRLKLMNARSVDELRRLRDEVFSAEQARWIAPGVSILKTASREPARLVDLQRELPDSVVILEYVVADPQSYCLVISKERVRIARLAGKREIEKLVKAYLDGIGDGRGLNNALLAGVPEVKSAKTLIVVRDGALHLVPFDAFQDQGGQYVAELTSISYAPSVTTYDLLARRQRGSDDPTAILAAGGVPYSGGQISPAGLFRSSKGGGFAPLPSSADEVRMVAAAIPGPKNRLLLGTAATESTVKGGGLENFRVLHFAVHAVADKVNPDRAALILLSDATAGEDGYLQASEVAQLRLNAELVVLSACDTSVGALQGQEGIANLSRAFLLAGARNVVSTLWPVEDDASLLLMKKFYGHLAAGKTPAPALAAAKRDFLRTLGPRAVPRQWAGFIIEGDGGVH